MKILVATDVINGPGEAGTSANRFLGFVETSRRHGVDLYVHEASRADVRRDADVGRRRAMLRVIDGLKSLKGVPTPPDDDLATKYRVHGGPGDILGVKLLHALTSNVVDILVTDDVGLQRRAKAAGLDPRVFSLDDATAWMVRTFEPTRVPLPSVEDAQAHQLDFDDPIFAGLREDYPDFDDWTAKIANERRDCWIVRRGARLAALVVRKSETHAEAGTKNTGPKILKICTFIVAADSRGQKLGEQLLKQILWYGQVNNFDLVYLTAFEKQATLLALLEDFGFERTRRRSKGDTFVEKPLGRDRLVCGKGETPLDATRRGYPRFVADDVGKYVIPIWPAFHAKLFPEYETRAGDLAGETPGVPGNTIEKVYLCHSPTRSLSQGDIVFFYMTSAGNTRGSQSLTTVGVVKSVRLSGDVDEVRRWTAKRSVYSDLELADMVAKGVLLIIDFLHIGHLPAAVSLDALTSEEVMNSWPQSIVKLSDTGYERLREMIDLGYDF